MPSEAITRLQISAVGHGAVLGGDAFQAIEQPGLVALGLQLADEPGAGVGQRLVIQIDGVLRRQQNADAERSRLLEQRQERLLARRIAGMRRQVAEHFVEVQQGAQVGGARLPAGPGQHLLQQERDEEHPLVVVEMRQVENQVLRPTVAVEHGRQVERLALRPDREHR